MMNRFSETLWSSIDGGIFAAIMDHPFIKGLNSGDLDEACFRQYIQQDALYLGDFGRGLALLAARSEGGEALHMFCDHARNALMVEQALHGGFIEAWKDLLDPSPEPSPACLAYTSFLLRTAYDRTWEEGLAAFLPCYWIYLKVGARLADRGSPHPLYRRWIETYAGEEYAKVVDEMLTLVDRAASDASPGVRQRMQKAFVTGSRYEFLFWDSAWRREDWPVK